MKKILAVLFALVLLAGCGSNAQTMVSDPDTVIISGNDITYTKQDLFNDLKKNDVTSVIRADLTNRIAGFEEIDMDEVTTKVNDYFEELKTQYADSYDSMLSYYGGEESFRKTIESSYTLDALLKKYCDYNLDSLVSEYTPVLAKMQSFSTQEEAQAMIDNIQNGMSFDDACTEAGITTLPTETVYLSTSDIDTQLIDYLSDSAVGVSEYPVVVLTDSTNDNGEVATTETYYVIETINRDVEEFKDEFYSAIGSEIDTTDVFNYYFNKYNIEVYDQDVYEALSSQYEGIN